MDEIDSEVHVEIADDSFEMVSHPTPPSRSNCEGLTQAVSEEVGQSAPWPYKPSRVDDEKFGDAISSTDITNEAKSLDFELMLDDFEKCRRAAEVN